ncbi:hypothetical protein GCM10009827_057700 [Dactylosporangium maewongense]|uniref:Uncharacterized protein n=1 Tax=Dactylosporangium maewongense TaxID=634393 RepID=A0ABP4LYC4_9ACTN
MQPIEETDMVRTKRLAVAVLVASAVAALYASDPKHETTGDPNPTVALTALSIASMYAADPKHESDPDPNPNVALVNGDPRGQSGPGGDPVG